jgi:hypothetical protein
MAVPALAALEGRKSSLGAEAVTPQAEDEDEVEVEVEVPESRVVPQTTVEEDKERDWSLKQLRLTAKVERKREESLAREATDGGAFPPPEVGYQFPSPVLTVSNLSCLRRRGS